ncbi:LacI family DNA-binding transcriptional regulator [Asticcacaulis benevestitus]|uniref:HTH lacI-type domain-containing protein n=1 Tax=Asticcacaulis benevestitus DSM 16100 = ATCC BAA-896 TaxID=1121022 RepID=V4PKF6_9CAUL|nr:LacI family DNA-binding transcriptional regulator [Asticcacaulis benevestitus]ESQ88696.1 hypothetical protein ABENE_15755 [Asticcacaulis benevestitus DSM 16100 = ATCC BAA-896]
MTHLTIMELAKRAQVSMKTISRVINKESGVGAKKRAEIEALIESLGFVPNAAARAMASSRSYLIGLLMHQTNNHYYPHELQIGAMRACRQRGYHLTVEETRNYEEGGLEGFRKRLLAARFDGIVLTPPVTEDVGLMALLEQLKLPYVRIAPVSDYERSSYVYMDDEAAGYEMTCYLIDRGHSEIAFLDNILGLASSDQRRSGYVRAMNEAGFTIRPEWSGHRLSYLSTRMEEVERLILLDTRPTAIFASADFLAFGAIAAAYKNGLTVPKDISIVGFDNSPGCESVWPPLTTVHQPIADMAETATYLLLDQFGGDLARPQKRGQKLPYHLVVRASVAPSLGRSDET